jgi:hypothetical protein
MSIIENIGFPIEAFNHKFTHNNKKPTSYCEMLDEIFFAVMMTTNSIIAISCIINLMKEEREKKTETGINHI